MATRSNAAARVTREEMVERARALLPGLKSRAAAVEANRRMAPETDRELTESGLYKVLTPKRFGGTEMDLGLLIDVAAELGRGCGSTAWVWGQLVGHDWVVGMMHPKAQDDIWGADPAALASSSFQNPGASVKRVKGGYVLDGSWGFASGCDYAEWNLFLCIVPREGGGPATHHFALAPRAEYEIEDDWFPVGLAGTGSKKLVVRELFIPEHRVVNMEDLRGGPSPGSEINPGPLYKVPPMGAGSKLFSGTTIGTALGALDAVEENFRDRVSVGGAKLSQQQSVHIRLAHAEGEIDAARALLERDCARAMDWGAKGVRPPLEDRVRWRRNDAFAIRMCVDSVDRLFPLMGGRGLAAAGAFQRAWRDCHATGQQIIVNWDLMLTHFGRLRMGEPVEDPRI